MINTLYYGDNLYYLREFPSESVDLIYLDPPFNSKATYNLLFRTPEGDAVQAQTAAFKDTWWWDAPAEQAFDDVMASGSAAAGILKALRRFLAESDMMAYLVMMTVRLVEMRRILKPTGSLYLHCDDTASHYLKLVMDAIFGPALFKNEIKWKRTTSHGNVARNYGTVTDSLLFYVGSQHYTWNQLYVRFSDEYIAKKFFYSDTDGRRWQSVTLRNPGPRPNLRFPFTASNGVTYQPHPNGWACDRARLEQYDRENRLHFPTKLGGQLRLKMYLDESNGVKIQNLWTDIPAINSQAQERLGYPTQKPLALMERLIAASSNQGDVILDPFCGCGTTIEAAESLDRYWTGIDITHHAIDIIEGRLNSSHPEKGYEVRGRPEDMAGAWNLARRDKYEFQWWANWLLGVQNYRERKKGADRGIDGIIYFPNGPWGVGEVIVSVKGGENLNPGMVSALRGTIEREEAQLGLFVCIAEPTGGMRREAAASGFVNTAQGRFQRIQIVTIDELLSGRMPAMPRPIESEAFRQPLRRARRAKEAQPPTPQLQLPLSFIGGKAGRKRADVEDHLSGRIIADVATAS